MTARERDPDSRLPLLQWMIFTGVCVFAAVLLWRYGLVQRMLLADRTHISAVICLLYIGTSLHCLWRTIVVSREGDAARHAARLVARGRRLTLAGDAVSAEGAGILPGGLIAAHIRDVVLKGERQGTRHPDQMMLLRSLATRLRGSNQFGAFASDSLMKLGLIGTIIGFIMMLAPIAGLDTGDQGSIKTSMNLMSDGMAVAMYTTLTGLVGSILVNVQYYMLEDATTKLLAFAVGLVDIYVGSPPPPLTGQPG